MKFSLKILLAVILLVPAIKSYSEVTDSLKRINQFGYSITLTNKGISTIPNFTLGKPAALFTMSIGRKLRFEPDLRFALEGRPWLYIYWWRYDLLKTNKWYTTLRLNYTNNFIQVTDTAMETANKSIRVLQVVTGDISHNYFITKNYSIGIYYMYSYGFDINAVKNVHYLVFRNSFTNIRLSKEYFLRFVPQFYYLKVDQKDGFYFSETLTLAKRNFPLSVSSIINQPLKTEIMINNHLIWNISLTYAFNREYVRK